MSFAVGVILVVVGSVSANLGNNLVSLGHRNTQEECLSKSSKEKDLELNHSEANAASTICDQPDEPVTVYSWTFIGRIIFVIGNLFNFAAFAFGSQSTLSSLESAEFVSNVFFVHYVHAEPITTRMTFATLSIVAGNVLVVVFGAQDAKKFTSDDMIHLYKTNTAYHAYMLLVFILWAVTSYAYSTYHDSRMRKRVLMWRHSFMEPLLYAVSSSIIGTQAVLNSKCLALLIDATSTGAKNEFAFWYLYMILGTWLLMVAYWLVRLDQSLALFPPAFIIPLMQVLFMIFAILCGGIYFQEFVHFTTLQYIMFAIGVALIVFGVCGLAPKGMQLHVPGDPDAPDVVVIRESVATGKVYSELVLPTLAQVDGPDEELDKTIDGALHSKPLPCQDDQNDSEEGLTELNIYAVAPVDVTNSTQVVDFASITDDNTAPSVMAKQHSPQVLPPVSTRGTNGMGLIAHSGDHVVQAAHKPYRVQKDTVPITGPRVEDLPRWERFAPSRYSHTHRAPPHSHHGARVDAPQVQASVVEKESSTVIPFEEN